MESGLVAIKKSQVEDIAMNIQKIFNSPAIKLILVIATLFSFRWLRENREVMD
jgi:hypothetical protein